MEAGWRAGWRPLSGGQSSMFSFLLASLQLLLVEFALLPTELALVSDMVLVFASTFGSVLSSTLSSAFAAVPPLRPLLPPGSGRAGGAVVFPALAPRPRFTAPLGDTDLAASTLALYIAVSDTVTDRSMPEGAATLPEGAAILPLELGVKSARLPRLFLHLLHRSSLRRLHQVLPCFL